jgi:hypothetical protein
MTDSQFDDLAGRIDGVARVLMTLICQLEDSNTLDGDRHDRLLRSTAEGRSTTGREKSATVIRQVADQLASARMNRSLAH